MIITFDGDHGSGKTTQIQRLSEEFGFQMCEELEWHRNFYMQCNGLVLNANWHTNVMAHLTVYSSLDFGRNWCIERFWSTIFNDASVSDAEITKVVDCIQQVMALGTVQPPILSIALQSAPETTLARMAQRELGVINDSLEIQESEQQISQRDNVHEMWGKLAERIPYFHVVNADDTVENVFGIVRKHLVDNLNRGLN